MWSSSAASAAPARTVVVLPSDRPSVRAIAAALQKHDSIAVKVAVADEPPARESLLGRARTAYAAMDFARTQAALREAERSLIEGRRPSAAVRERLADVEVWLGACLLLNRDRRGADERFALAKALRPDVAADPIFPPEVAAALREARPGAAVSVQLVAAPMGARLWIDGAPAPRDGKLSQGLHYVVAERADRRPSATLLRVSSSATRLELAAGSPVAAEVALAALADLPRDTLGPSDGLEVSRIARGSVWRIDEQDGGLYARRYAAQDAARPTSEQQLGSPAAVERAVCELDVCDGATPIVARPVWKRPWFWGVVGGAAAVVVAGVIAGAVVATAPHDYRAVVR